MDLNLLSYSVGGLCAGLAVWNIWCSLRQPPRPHGDADRFSLSQRKSIERIDTFQKKIRALEQKVELVEEHAGEYFFVLHENGWPDVISILEQLDGVLSALDALVKQGSIASAEHVIAALDGAGESSKVMMLHPALAHVDILVHWEQRVNTVMIDVAEKLADAAEHTKTLGIDRSRKRKPTLVAVEELMKMLEYRNSKKAKTEEW